MLVGSVVLPKLRRPIAGCCFFQPTQMAPTESVTLDSNSRLKGVRLEGPSLTYASHRFLLFLFYL
jgi:hypothetical protein